MFFNLFIFRFWSLFSRIGCQMNVVELTWTSESERPALPFTRGLVPVPSWNPSCLSWVGGWNISACTVGLWRGLDISPLKGPGKVGLCSRKLFPGAKSLKGSLRSSCLTWWIYTQKLLGSLPNPVKYHCTGFHHENLSQFPL